MPLKLKRHMNIRCAFNESVLTFSWFLVYWYVIYVYMIYLVFDVKWSVIALSWPTTGILLVCFFFQKDFIIVVLICVTYFESFAGCVLCTFPVIESFCMSKLKPKKNHVCAILDSFGLLNWSNHIIISLCTYCISRCIWCLKLHHYFEFYSGTSFRNCYI